MKNKENERRASDGVLDERETVALTDRATSLSKKIGEIPEKLIKMWKENRADAKKHARESLIGAGFAVLAYLFGACELPFGTYPLGLALLCSAPSRVAWILAGLCAASLSLEGAAFIYIFAYATALTVRLLSRLLSESDESEGEPTTAFFSEGIYLRMATALISAFMIGIYTVIINGFQYYHLFGTVLSMVLSPALTFVYSGAFVRNNKRFFELSVAALLTSAAYSIREMQIIGISLGVLFAFSISLFVCRRRGVWRGAVIGLLTGLAYSPVYAPVFVIAPIAAGALFSVSSLASVAAASSAGMIWGFYVEGIGAISRLLPALILASAVFLWAERVSFLPAARELLISGRYCADMNRATIDRESRSRTEQRLSSLGEAFSSLSDVFYNLSSRLSRPDVPELERMCDGVYDRYCPTCPNRELCWGLEYAESRALLSMLGEKLKNGKGAEPCDLPEYMRRRCQALPGIVGEINERSAELFRLSSSLEKSEIFAMDYAALSEILRDTEAAIREENEPDEELCERVSSMLSEYGFGEGGVSVYGKRMKRIVARGFDLSLGRISADELQRKLEETCGFPVSEPIIEIKEGFMTLRVSSARAYSVTSVTRVGSVGGEECGDTVSSFESCEDRAYALISDGMGKGRAAAFTSGVSSMFAKRMLESGNRAPTVIRMLNSFVRSKHEECSATVDLMELDLLTGKVDFYKCGAAATYVKRRDNLFKLAAQTVPLGILSATDTAKLSFDAEDGDVIIMLSDGIAQGDEDAIWLFDVITREWEDDADKMAKKIICAARKHGSEDDASVILTRVEKREE